MRWLVALYCLAAVTVPLVDTRVANAILTPGDDPSALGWALAVAVVACSASVYVIVTHCNPNGRSARLLVYLLAVILSQGQFVINAVDAILHPAQAAESAITGRGLLFTYLHAALSVTVFFVVRWWVKQRTDVHIPIRTTRLDGVLTLSASFVLVSAVGAAVLGDLLSGGVQTLVSSPRDAAQDFNTEIHVRSGTAHQWLAQVADSVVAGVFEEPVIIGLAVLLWPYRGRIRPLISVLILTTIARFSIHVYYAAGQNVSVVLAIVFLWCLVWSGTYLAVAYATRSLAPIIVAHAISNYFVSVRGDWDFGSSPLKYLAVGGFLVLGCAALLAVACFLALALAWIFAPLIRRHPWLTEGASLSQRGTGQTDTDAALLATTQDPETVDGLDSSQFESFYSLLPDWAQHEYQARTKDTNDYLQGLARGEFLDIGFQLNVERWQALADESAHQCDSLLKQLSPNAALNPVWTQLPDELLAVVDNYGAMNRFRWVLAATATGHSTDMEVLESYIQRVGCYWGAITMVERGRNPQSEAQISIDGAPNREFMHRTSSQVIRFHWAAEMIALEICRQIQADPQFATHLADFTEENARACLQAAFYYAGVPGSPLVPPEAPGMALAKRVSVEAGKVKLPFAQATVSTRLEACPWVLYPNGLAPMATTSALMAMDRSLLAAVDKHLHIAGVRSNKITKGELFERVSQQCISQSLAFGGHTYPRDCSVRIGGDKQDVDVNIADPDTDTVPIIGEVKAMESSDPIGNTAPNFADQLGVIHKQLTKRLNAFTAGIPLIDGTGAAHQGTADTLGLGIVLHPYGVSLGDPVMLNVLNSEHRQWRIATSELHSWMLILSAMSDINDLSSYLRFRHELIEIGVLFNEECDSALAYFEGAADRLLHLYRAGKERCPPSRQYKPILNGVQVDFRIALCIPRPTGWEQWRYILCAITKSTPLPFSFNEDGVIGPG